MMSGTRYENLRFGTRRSVSPPAHQNPETSRKYPALLGAFEIGEAALDAGEALIPQAENHRKIIPIMDLTPQAARGS